MLSVKLCVVLFAFTIIKTCPRVDAKSSSSMRVPRSSGTLHKTEEQAAALRRQLMRDNYDYTHSDDERKHTNVTSRAQRGHAAPAKGKEDVPASEATQTESKSYSAEHEQDEHSGDDKQPGQYEELGHNEQHDQYEQPGAFVQRSRNDKPDQNEQPGHDEHYEQPGQYVQRSKIGHDSKREQNGQEQLNHYDTRVKLGVSSEQEHPEQQFEEQDPVQYEEQTFRSKPAYIDNDELTVRDVNEPKYTMERSYTGQVQGGANPTRDDTNPTQEDTNSARSETEPAGRHKESAREPAYDPFYNKHPEGYKTKRGVAPQAKPFSDLRGDFREQYGQNDAGVQPEHEPQAANEENYHDDQEAIDQQNISDSQDEGSDYSESKKQSREVYNEFGHTTRTNRLQPAAGRGTSHRGHSSLTYQEPDTPSGYHHAPQDRHHKAPSGRDNYRPSHGDSNTPHHQDRKSPLDINISKKDLLYYMDDTQLRRNNNEMSPDVTDDEDHPLPSADPNSPALRPSPTHARATPTSSRASLIVTRTSPTDARVGPTLARASPTIARVSPTVARASPTVARVSPTVGRASPSNPRVNSVSTKRSDFPSTQHVHRSPFVTVSPTNVTYKLLTLKTREGRRRGERRILEERRPEGVAIISLDEAPLPAFRLPRARRQYMHEHHQHRSQPA